MRKTRKQCTIQYIETYNCFVMYIFIAYSHLRILLSDLEILLKIIQTGDTLRSYCMKILFYFLNYFIYMVSCMLCSILLFLK